MLWVFFSLLGVLLFLFIRDQFISGKGTRNEKPLPLKGILVSGVLYYLLSRGFLTEEEGAMLESLSLEELEDYLTANHIITKQEWVELVVAEYESSTIAVFEKDLPFN